jgi:alanyl-tRNA synthetase
VIAVNDAAQSAGLSARTLIAAVTGPLDGKGGGRDDIAQGGGSRPQAAADALSALRAAVAARD